MKGILARSFSHVTYDVKVKADKKLLKSSLTAMDVLYLIMLHNNGNIDKKFQLSIFYRSRKNQLKSKSA